MKLGTVTKKPMTKDEIHRIVHEGVQRRLEQLRTEQGIRSPGKDIQLPETRAEYEDRTEAEISSNVEQVLTRFRDGQIPRGALRHSVEQTLGLGTGKRGPGKDSGVEERGMQIAEAMSKCLEPFQHRNQFTGETQAEFEQWEKEVVEPELWRCAEELAPILTNRLSRRYAPPRIVEYYLKYRGKYLAEKYHRAIAEYVLAEIDELQSTPNRSSQDP